MKLKHLAFIQTLHSGLENAGIDAHQWEIRSLQAVGSTNTRVQDMLGLYDKVVVMAETQSKGRGREQKVWYSPTGGLWVSLGFMTDAEVIELSTPVVEEIQKVLSPIVPAKIKDPNDILIDGRKLCGILVETKIKSNRLKQVIIGMGMNITNEIPDEVSDIATRLKDHVDEVPDMYQLATDIVVAVINRLGSIIPK